jgi:hypothetical protein
MVDKAIATAGANPLSAEGVAALAAVAALPPVMVFGAESPGIVVGMDLGSGDYSAPAPLDIPSNEMSEIQKLFTTASQHLKKPSIKINTGSGVGLSLKPSIKNNGNIFVASDKGTGWSSKFFGTIFTDGTFKPKLGVSPSVIDMVKATLLTFAADPAGVAAEYGKLHGKCCFCNKGLSDEKSTSVGYGPICAGHFGLPWGDNTSPGASALKKLAQKFVKTGVEPEMSSVPTPSPTFTKPKGVLHEELKQVAAASKEHTGEKVVPLLSPEEYARMKARVQVLF